MDEFRIKLESCEIGFQYSKLQLFKYLLGNWDKQELKRVGIVVSIQFAQVEEGVYRPYLLFKRLETDYEAGSGDVSLFSYSDVFLDFKFVNMIDKSVFDIRINHSKKPELKLDIKAFKSQQDPLNCFHKSLFSIAQLKIIKEFIFDTIVFSPSYINYKNSYFYSDKIQDVSWFTFKIEGNFKQNNNLTLREDDGTHLPIIEVGSPCPPMWHDGDSSD